MHDHLTLTGSKGTTLYLFGVVETERGLRAEGYLTQEKLRKGRVMLHGKRKYKLTQALSSDKVYYVPDTLSGPITLEVYGEAQR